jgi:hypothetical protein
MPFTAFSEPKLMDMFYGGFVAQCNQSISAGTASQSSITIMGSAGSGNADHTPVNGEIWVIATPGTGTTVNQFTNFDCFTVSGSPTATSLTFASRTVVAVRAVGDVCFVLNTTTGPSQFGNVLWYRTLYAALGSTSAQGTVGAGNNGNTISSTATIAITVTEGTFPNSSGNVILNGSAGPANIAYTGFSAGNLTGCTSTAAGIMSTSDIVYLVPTQTVLLASEASGGSYARVAVPNNVANFTATTGSFPGSKTTGATITFPASTATWGATAFNILFFADTTTLGGGNVVAWAYLTTAQLVTAANITPSVASGQYTHALL